MQDPVLGRRRLFPDLPVFGESRAVSLFWKAAGSPSIADANVLLSAVTGGRARLVLARADLANVVTTRAALDEFNENAEPLARTLRLPLGTVLAVATLSVTVADRDEYASMREAERRIGQRDPDDIDTLARGEVESALARQALASCGRTWGWRQEWRLDSLRGLSCPSERRPQSWARPVWQTRLLGPRSHSGSEVLEAPWGGLGPLLPGSDQRRYLFQDLGREHAQHLGVPGLLLHLRNSPDLLEQPWPVGVDG